MPDGNVYEADGIVVLDATEDVTKKMDIGHIVLSGTAAGSFVFTLGNVPLTITTGANDLSKVVPVNRTVNYIKLTSGPTGAVLYAFLKKK